jgi:hypothetical protein
MYVSPTVMAEAQRLYHRQQEASASVKEAMPFLLPSIVENDYALFSIIDNIIADIEKVVLIDMDNFLIPEVHKDTPTGTLILVAGTPRHLLPLNLARENPYLLHLMKKQRFFVLPCSEQPEEADQRLANLAAKIARTKQGLDYHFLSKDKGFCITANTIDKLDPLARTDVLGCRRTKDTPVSLRQCIDVFRTLAKRSRPQKPSPSKTSKRVKL